jgi:lysozyme family protein
MTFEDAFKVLIGHEGGYVNDPKDPGGETKYGISKRAYPGEDIANLTLARAQAIYHRDFWDVARADELPKHVRFAVFDAAVNSGVRQAVKWLQRAVGVADDGVIGHKTLSAVVAMEPYKLAAVFNGQRLKFMTELETFGRFGKGWSRRIAENLINLP